MPDLYPAFPTPPAASPDGASGVTYGKGWAFDFAAGDFVVDGAGRVPLLDGANTWAQWCVKAVLTERLTQVVYGPGYGGEVMAAIRSAVGRKAAESEAARAITEALMADVRTARVRDFSFVWVGDSLRVGFTAEPAIGSSMRLEVDLNGG